MLTARPRAIKKGGEHYADEPGAHRQLPDGQPLFELVDDQALYRFVSEGGADLSEDQVKGAVKVALERSGWHVRVRYGREQGIDLEANRRDERFVIEAKGVALHANARRNDFAHVLGDLLRRMESGEPSYAIALPAHRDYAGHISRLPMWVRAHLKLHFFVARLASANEYVVGHLGPPAGAA